MQIPVLVEPVAGKGYVARTGSPFGWSAEGATAAEAVERLQAEVVRHSTNGIRVTTIEWPDPGGEHPLRKWVGTLPDDDLTRMWREAVEEYRREIDSDPNR